MEFSKLEIEHAAMLRPYFMENQCRICDCTLGCTFIWRDHHGTEFAVEDGVLYLKVAYPVPAFAPPRGAGVSRRSYDRIIEYCAAKNMPARLRSVSEAALQGILEVFQEAAARTERDWSDYLYRAEDIINLAGRRYSGQRNHINRFMRQYPDWKFERVTESNLSAVKTFIQSFTTGDTGTTVNSAGVNNASSAGDAANAGVSKRSPAYIEGNMKTLEVLDNLDLYRQFGGALTVSGEIVGVSLGEILGDTLYIHAEKAKTAFHGSYPMLANQFARHFCDDGTRYVNREEDDGIEGLRTSKLSYHPTELLSKYIVELRV